MSEWLQRHPQVPNLFSLHPLSMCVAGGGRGQVLLFFYHHPLHENTSNTAVKVEWQQLPPTLSSHCCSHPLIADKVPS